MNGVGLARRVGAELIGEERSDAGIRRQTRPHTPAPLLGHHQLAQRLLVEQVAIERPLGELGGVGELAEPERCGRGRPHGTRSRTRRSCTRRLRPLGIAVFRKQWPAIQCQRTTRRVERFAVASEAQQLERPLRVRAKRIHIEPIDVEPVTAGIERKALAPNDRTKSADEDCHLLARAGRQRVRPAGVHEPIDGDHAAMTEGEHLQDRSCLATPDFRRGHAVDGKSTQQVDAEALRFLCVPGRYV